MMGIKFRSYFCVFCWYMEIGYINMECIRNSNSIIISVYMFVILIRVEIICRIS